ncbi:bifunctional diguanylate cyclase/phosphodiesterase [Pseudoalteromonas sp. T1lg75]|uniref:bifunctional diguanylate cyclase/phosphodiesterase n=1 Tax=Pseudoalteromonas sp. T1lg75 TaxID=2077102 RepID=UPI000CF6EBD9|nr:EAL domain-containing protein [Pseudoalteromonas sp. T1lg75]
MVYRRPPSRFGIHSLSIKLSVLISAICLIAGIFAAVFMLKSEQKQLMFQENEQLNQYSARFIGQFGQLIDSKTNIAEQANAVVARELFSAERDYSAPMPQFIATDESTLRSVTPDGMSAAVMPKANYSPYYQQLFTRSEALWRIISPTLTQEFFNYYLLTADDFVRIAPATWAMDAPENYRANNAVNFSRVGPELNPDRLAVWTPVYYDRVGRKWVVSIVTPIYQNNEHTALTGADIELSNLLSFLPIDDKHQQMFVVDGKGQLLAHPNLDDATYQRYGREGRTLRMSDFINPQLVKLVGDALRLELPTMTEEFEYDGEQYLTTISKVDGLDWYVGIYRKQSSALEALEALQLKFLGLFILYAILVALLLHQALYQLVLRRIYLLVDAVSSFGKGKMDTEFPPEGKDEIGVLNGSFKDMSVELINTITGLNQRIKEKDIAEQAANRLSKAVAHSGTGVLITNYQLQIEYVNPKMLEMTGFDEEHFTNAKLLSVIAKEMAIFNDDIEYDLRTRNYWRGDTMLEQIDGHALWVSLSVSPIRDEEGGVNSYVVSAQDISFVKESQRKMEQLAYFDTLTGLANRTFFRMQLRKSMALAERGHYAFALFYFDLDEFKRINDTLGHDSGDQLLVEVANRLKNRLRTEDTIARLGGDEFAVLLSGIESQERAKEVAHTIQRTLNQPITLGNNEVIVSASIGITMAPDDSSEEDQLLKHADLAMYEAKAKGKNTYHFYSSELNAAANERLYIENELRQGIRDSQFHLNYQPQVDSRTGKVLGFEALIRWTHPTQGAISPVKFIPIAEATGLIVELGEWVLREACRFSARRAQAGLEANISVNLSVRQFQDANLIPCLANILEQTKVAPKNLHLELTESMLMGDVDTAISQLHDIKRLGVSISIDDFGTGYSSLNYLKRFPVDVLKVDRSFVQDIPHDPNDMAITAAIIAMAQKLNLNVVAEGVETREQMEFLKANNCFVVQGYYFSPPLTEQGVAELPNVIFGYEAASE